MPLDINLSPLGWLVAALVVVAIVVWRRPSRRGQDGPPPAATGFPPPAAPAPVRPDPAGPGAAAPAAPSAPDEDGFTDAEQAVLDAAIADVTARTAQPVLRLTAQPGPTGPLDSKLGGLPWLPATVAWPRRTDRYATGAPLQFLGQLNFGQLPALPGFPDRGLVQFFIGGDDLMGADFDHPTDPAAFRVLYHPELPAEPVTGTARPPLTAAQAEADEIVFTGEGPLTARLDTMALAFDDYRFHDVFLAALAKHAPGVAGETLEALYGRAWDQLNDHFGSLGHLVGGYASFIQEDPRFAPALAGYTVSLFQVDTDDDLDLWWGDAGVAHFFTTEAALAARTFDDVLYTWDCG